MNSKMFTLSFMTKAFACVVGLFGISTAFAVSAVSQEEALLLARSIVSEQSMDEQGERWLNARVGDKVVPYYSSNGLLLYYEIYITGSDNTRRGYIQVKAFKGAGIWRSAGDDTDFLDPSLPSPSELLIEKAMSYNIDLDAMHPSDYRFLANIGPFSEALGLRYVPSDSILRPEALPYQDGWYIIDLIENRIFL